MPVKLIILLVSELLLLIVCMTYVKMFVSVHDFQEGIRSHFGTPTWQTLGVFLAGVLTTVLVIRKM